MKLKIKKFMCNRKLYDLTGKGYITLKDLALRIQDDHDILVKRDTDGVDITIETLTQVLLKAGKIVNRDEVEQTLLYLIENCIKVNE